MRDEFRGKRLDRKLGALPFLWCVCEADADGREMKAAGIEIADDGRPKWMAKSWFLFRLWSVLRIRSSNSF